MSHNNRGQRVRHFTRLRLIVLLALALAATTIQVCVRADLHKTPHPTLLISLWPFNSCAFGGDAFGACRFR